MAVRDLATAMEQVRRRLEALEHGTP